MNAQGETYAIGDVQGCYAALQRLLEKIDVNPQRDTLWFVGDLVNRGSQSLEVLRFIKALPNAITVLGNHDLALLAVAAGAAKAKPDDTFDAILNAPDREDLLRWLRQQPLLHHEHGYTLVHAGIYPWWTLAQAQRYANELETVLREQADDFFPQMYGDQPAKWSEQLDGWQRLRFICNAFTRMRYCYTDGRIEFIHHAHPRITATAAPELTPWFNVSDRIETQQRIVFGHWASLRGEIHTPYLHAIDTGCVWGETLTAMRLSDGQLFSIVG